MRSRASWYGAGIRPLYSALGYTYTPTCFARGTWMRSSFHPPICVLRYSLMSTIHCWGDPRDRSMTHWMMRMWQWRCSRWADPWDVFGRQNGASRSTWWPHFSSSPASTTHDCNPASSLSSLPREPRGDPPISRRWLLIRCEGWARYIVGWSCRMGRCGTHIHSLWLDVPWSPLETLDVALPNLVRGMFLLHYNPSVVDISRRPMWGARLMG